MKNKKKLLIAVAAMGLLAVGTAGVGTAAWFQASEATVQNVLTPETGTVTVGYTDASVGTFTFVLDNMSGDGNAVDLTEQATGKSYVYLDNTTNHKQEVTPTHPTSEFSGLTWVVNYSGPSNTAAKIQVEWEELTSRYSKASVAATSDVGNPFVVRFGNTGAAATGCANGPYAMATNVDLTAIEWTAAPGGSGPYTSSKTLTLTKTAFAVALTGTDTNDGEFPVSAPTCGITIATTLAA